MQAYTSDERQLSLLPEEPPPNPSNPNHDAAAQPVAPAATAASAAPAKKGRQRHTAQEGLIATLQRFGLAVLDAIDRRGTAGATEKGLRAELSSFGATSRMLGQFLDLGGKRGMLALSDKVVTLTEAGATLRAQLTQRVSEPVQELECPSGWTPIYGRWRHGGFYVFNTEYPTGGSGCLSRNYVDKKWRIVCDYRRSELGEEGDETFPSRDAAARAEHVFCMSMEVAWTIVPTPTQATAPSDGEPAAVPCQAA